MTAAARIVNVLERLAVAVEEIGATLQTTAATEEQLAAQAVDYAQQTTISWDEYLRRVLEQPGYQYKNTKWYQAGGSLEQTKHLPAPPIAASLFAHGGILTDQNADTNRADYLAGLLGPTPWACQQAQNGTNIKGVDLSAWHSAGFKVGVWGVTYAEADFARDGNALAQRAIETGSSFLVIDAEECLKNADPSPLIEALARFDGKRALTTYGAASGENVFPMRWDMFFDPAAHGLPGPPYDLLLQAYYQIAPEYHPVHCYHHLENWCNAYGYPYEDARARTHLMIYTSMSASDIYTPVTAADQVQMCDEAGCTGDVSLFMPEFDYDYEGLRPLYD